MLLLSLMRLLVRLLDLDQAIHVSAGGDVLQLMNLPCFAEGDVPRSIRRIICLSIMLDYPNVCCLDSDNEVRKFMIVQREMLSWLKRYFPYPHEVVLEKNPTTDRTVLFIWFHLLCPLILLSHKLRLTCMLLKQTLWCSIQRLQQTLLQLLAKLCFLREKPLTFTNLPVYDVCVLNTTKSQVFSCSAEFVHPFSTLHR